MQKKIEIYKLEDSETAVETYTGGDCSVEAALRTFWNVRNSDRGQPEGLYSRKLLTAIFPDGVFAARVKSSE